MSPKLPDSDLSKEKRASTSEEKKDIPQPNPESKKPINFYQTFKAEKLKQKELEQAAKALAKSVLHISEKLPPKHKHKN
jgi:hypothetical protein